MRVIQQNFFFSVGNSILYLVTVSQIIILLRSMYNQHRKVQIKFGFKVYHKTKANLLFFFLSLFLGMTSSYCQGSKENLEVVWLCWKSSLIVICRVFFCYLCYVSNSCDQLYLYFCKIYLKILFLFILFIYKKDLCLKGFEKHIFNVCVQETVKNPLLNQLNLLKEHSSFCVYDWLPVCWLLAGGQPQLLEAVQARLYMFNQLHHGISIFLVLRCFKFLSNF